uniref:DUF38 domain-containing protein n=1 Tax=Panagrolaimus sp. JU765 TaxID=591449 RepID=A0AC34QDY9_9BILA
MIADEIVHNSIPEDRIQFATTCKAFNQIVKHAKPKKIIRELRIGCRTDVSCLINSKRVCFMTLPELKKSLQQYQVEHLSLLADSSCDEHFFSELMDLLTEPCRFVTVLSIDSYNPEFNYVDFYKKLKYLKSLTIYDSSRMIRKLPYFPSKLELKNKYCLPLLAEKTLNRPLSFLKITNDVQLTDIQQFLMTANLEIGAQIHFRFDAIGFLTFIGNGLFEFEVPRSFRYLILDQRMSTQNKKSLKLSTDFRLYYDEEIPFTVTSVSNPDNVVFSGELTTKSREIVFENFSEVHFVKISFPRPEYSIYYTPQLLDNWFPRIENYDPFERVETINKTLGTKIVVVKPEMLEKSLKNPKL